MASEDGNASKQCDTIGDAGTSSVVVSTHLTQIVDSIVGVSGNVNKNSIYLGVDNIQGNQTEDIPGTGLHKPKSECSFNPDVDEAIGRDLKEILSKANKALCHENPFEVKEFAVSERPVETFFAYQRDFLALLDGGLQVDEILQKSNMIVVGPAGIGKTFFLKALVKHVSSENFSNPFSFLFYLNVEDIDFTKTYSVLQFLLQSSAPEWMHTEKFSQGARLEKLLADENVLIIIDGEHKIPYNSYLSSKENKSEAVEMLESILEGKILPTAKKVVSCKPWVNYRLLFGFHTLRILGIKKCSQKLYGSNHVGESCKDLMCKNPQISHYMHIPVVLHMACSYFKNHKSISVPLTLSSLFTESLVQVATNQLEYFEENIVTLCHMAWLCTVSNKWYFKEKDLNAVKLSKETISHFLKLSKIKSLHVNITKYKGGLIVKFLSHMWQECLASIYHFLSSTNQLKTDWGNNKLSQVMKIFLFGICNRHVFYQLKNIIPTLTLKWIEIKCCLTELLVSSQYNITEKAHFLYAAQNNELLFTFVTRKNLPHRLRNGRVLLKGTVLPSDVASLCYVLQADVEENGEIETFSGQEIVPRCNFVENAFKVLTTEISSGIQINQLDFSGLKIGDAGAECLSCCIKHVNSLLIDRCNITSLGLLKFTNRLKNTKLTGLHLRGNKIMDEGAKLLAPCLENLSELYLDDCHITSDGVEKLSEYLLLLSDPIACLSLKGNGIGDTGAEMLSFCLEKIRKMLLSLCQISDQGMVKIANKTENLTEPIKYLDLSDNDIGQNGAKAFSQCGGKILKLRMVSCGLTPKQRKIIKDNGIELVFCGNG